MDDDVFEEDEHFYLHLRNLRVRTKDGLILDPSRIGGLPVAQLEMPATATIMILGKKNSFYNVLEESQETYNSFR